MALTFLRQYDAIYELVQTKKTFNHKIIIQGNKIFKEPVFELYKFDF